MKVKWNKYSFIEENGRINFDSIFPDTPPEVLWNGEWIRGDELMELYRGADRTCWVEGIKAEDGSIYIAKEEKGG
ncbi:MAG: hypothetical protein ACTSPV_05175 [Candidatus Hodarchaeales archaeon]